MDEIFHNMGWQCATGWFSARMLDTLRLCVAVRFLSIYPEAGAKSLLKSISERFEKSKKMLILAKNNPRPGGGQHQVNKGSDQLLFYV